MQIKASLLSMTFEAIVLKIKAFIVNSSGCEVAELLKEVASILPKSKL